MNIRLAKDDFAFNGPGSVNYSPVPADGAERARAFTVTRPSGLVGRARAWLAQAQRRRQAMNELQMLTDHELSDIGLVRSEIPMIFEPGFAEQYDSRRRHV
jgi:uncharacterized protein YjiS (DUF1127 family)